MAFQGILRFLQRTTVKTLDAVCSWFSPSPSSDQNGSAIDQIQHFTITCLLILTLIFTVDLTLYLGTGRSIVSAFILDANLPVNPCENFLCPLYLEERQHWYKAQPSDGQEHTVAIVVPFYTENPKYLIHLLDILCCLNYPKELVSLVILEGSNSTQNDTTTSYSIKSFIQDVQDNIRRLEIVSVTALTAAWAHPDLSKVKEDELFSRGTQFLDLLKITEDFILWIDLNVTEVPSDLIQRFIMADKDVLVANCQVRNNNNNNNDKDLQSDSREVYWAARRKIEWKFQEKLAREYNEWLSANTNKSLVVSTILPPPVPADENMVLEKVDQGGSCMAFISTQLYTKDLLLPALLEKHLALNATFGLQMMAENIGTSTYAIPDLIIFHKSYKT